MSWTAAELRDAAIAAHRQTSGSGGCAEGQCDYDDHDPAWHDRFADRFMALLIHPSGAAVRAASGVPSAPPALDGTHTLDEEAAR